MVELEVAMNSNLSWVTTFVSLIVYDLMTPFCWSAGGGDQVTLAVYTDVMSTCTFCGGPLGTEMIT